jgi:hypothetical protein
MQDKSILQVWLIYRWILHFDAWRVGLNVQGPLMRRLPSILCRTTRFCM